MHTVLLTAAGESTRFPGEAPKWVLTHPEGFMMAVHAVKDIPHDRLVIALNDRDMRRYDKRAVLDEFHAAGEEFNVAGFRAVEVVNVGRTESQVETALNALNLAGIGDSDGETITVRDCDSSFAYALPPILQSCSNYFGSVAVKDLHDTQCTTPGNKSYVTLDEMHRVRHTAEKKIISSLFCCGAYTFSNAHLLRQFASGQQYMSQAIAQAIRAGGEFAAVQVQDYDDWGTLQDWERYCAQYATLFVDIDGVLVEGGHRSLSPRWGFTPQLADNVAFLNQLVATGKVEVILTTARPEEKRKITEQQLHGLRYHRLIMGLRTCPRTVINDVLPHRSAPTAHAVNLTRNGQLAPSLRWLLRR